jgi:biopolymer transport protein ExbD
MQKKDGARTVTVSFCCTKSYRGLLSLSKEADMFSIHNRTISPGKQEDSQIDLKPFINFLLVLVPVLMLSAEFSNVSVVKVTAPPKGADPTHFEKARPIVTAENLSLVVLVSDSALTIGTNAGFLPSIYYKEFHRYVLKSDTRIQTTVEYNPLTSAILSAINGEPIRKYDKQDIILYAKNPESNTVVKALYSKEWNALVLGRNLQPAKSIARGDSFYYADDPERIMVAKNPNDYEMRPLSAYDILRWNLAQIRMRYYHAVPDPDNIIIASENHVVYDKIIQIMDAARAVGFSNVSIAKLRA